MHFSFIAFISVFLLNGFFQNAYANKKKQDSVINYHVSGTIKGASDSEYVVLKFFGTDRVDTCYFSNGNFSFEGKVPAPTYTTFSYKYFNTDIFLEDSSVLINGDSDAPEEINAGSSGIYNKELENIHSLIRAEVDSSTELYIKVDSLQKKDAIKNKLATSICVKQIKYHENKMAHIPELYVSLHPASIPGIVTMLSAYSTFQIPVQKPLLTKVIDASENAGIKSSYVEMTKRLRSIEQMKEGKLPFFDLQGYDTIGKAVQLSAIRGKYTLVHFWASWCVPCRKQNIALRKLYQQYHSKGFTILNISVDDKKDMWLNAIKKDQLPGYHTCDFKGMNDGRNYYQYGVKFVGDSYLINSQRTVVGVNLDEKKLQAFLANKLK